VTPGRKKEKICFMNNYRKYFNDVIREKYPSDSDILLRDVENHYKIISKDTRFAATSGNPIDKRLDFCAYFLALIKTLDARKETYETIRKVCLEIVIDYVQPRNKIHRLLKKLPAKLLNTWLATALVKALHKKVSRNSHPDGFIANIIADKEQTFGLGYGIDILECGICKLFSKHNFQKYSSILCEVDEVTSGLAGLQLIRTGTIALGANKCDFRFKKV
jgi:hypothetical protein